MDLFFPRLKPWQYALLACLFVICWVFGAPFEVGADGVVYAEPLTIIAAGIAMGALSGGAQLLGQHVARKKYEESDIGKAEAAILKEQAKIAKTPLEELGLTEGQKRKAVTMALEQARSQKRQLEDQQMRARDVRGPVRSGIEAIQDTKLREAMLQAGAAARSDIESQSAQLALARKQGAQGVVLPAAQSRLAQMQQTAALAGSTFAGGAAGGVAAAGGYYQGAGAGTGTGTTKYVQTQQNVNPTAK